MIEAHVAMYRKGAITLDHLVVQCLHAVDPADPALVLSLLPPDILRRILEFTRHYKPGGMVANYGLLPASDQVTAAKNWIEKEFQWQPEQAHSAS